MKFGFSSLRAAACLLLAFGSVKADIITSLGNTSSGFTSGQHPIGTATVLAAMSGQPAPFNAFCGSDASANCSTNWTFNYLIPLGQSVSSATITLGIYDIDSAATGNQVGLFSLTSGDDLTNALNTVSEGLNGGAGAANAEFDILSITIPSTSFALLDGGTATFNLNLQGPGLGVLGNTTFNGAALVYSTLDLQTQTSTTPPVPEPSTWLLLLAGVGSMIMVRTYRTRAEGTQATPQENSYKTACAHPPA